MLCALFLFKITTRHNCFNYFKRILPKEQVKELEWLLTLRCRRLKVSKNIEFTKLCIKHGIYTSDLRQRITKNKLKPTATVCNDFLKAELTNAQEILAKIDSSISDVLHVLKSLDFIGFCKYYKFTRFSMQKLRNRLDMKYRRLRDNCAPLFPADMDSRIVNLSSRVLTDTEKQALCLGLDFCIAPKRVEQIRINAEFENLFQQLHDVLPSQPEDLATLKANLVSTAATYGHSHIERSALLPCHVDVLTRLKKDGDIVILKPDKGGGVVVMDRSDYVSKVQAILGDASKFKLDARQVDKTPKVSKALTDILKRMEQRGIITKALRLQLTPKSPALPRMYGLPKTHKDGVPS